MDNLDKRKRHSMSATANKRIARRFFDDVLAGGSERAVDELIAPDATVFMPTGRFTGPAGVKRASAQIASAFPDRRVEVRALVADGNRVAVEWTLCGTQQRELDGVSPTGRRECTSAMSVFRVADGRIIEHWMTEGISALSSFQPEAARRGTSSTGTSIERIPHQ
jgi:predicted ester cyclase